MHQEPEPTSEVSLFDYRTSVYVGGKLRTPDPEELAITSKIKASPREFERGERLLWGEAYISFLPDSNEMNRIKGSLFITNYRLIFTPDDVVPVIPPLAGPFSNLSPQWDAQTKEIRLPLCCILKFALPDEKGNSQEKKKNRMIQVSQKLQERFVNKEVSPAPSISAEYVDILCKDSRVLRFSFLSYLSTRPAVPSPD